MKNYIQIGANVGEDHFFEEIKRLNDRSNIYLIEPNAHLISRLTKCYKILDDIHNIHIINAGVVHDESINKLYVAGTAGGHSAVCKRKSLPENYFNDILEFTPLILNKFFIEKNIQEVELLYIDTEGYDYMILDSINFNNFKIKNIECEYWSYDNDYGNETIQTGPLAFKKLRQKIDTKYDISECIRDEMKTHLFKLK
jgi:FkbM family methyltransferase